ncbi:phosphotransferase [Streptodolium elevatio]
MPRREPWEALPEGVRRAVERHTGPVRSAIAPEHGRLSEFSARLETEHGPVFCKGVRTYRPYASGHRNEAALAGFLPAAVAPLMLWTIERDGWLLLGFEVAEGQSASLAPGSPDLAAVRDLVVTMAQELTPCPTAARDLTERWANAPSWSVLYVNPPGDLDPWAYENVDTLAALERRLSLAGNTLAHVDLNPGNVLVNGTHALAVDWAWASRGPVWLDPAYLVTRLIAHGHPPKEAEAWARTIPAFAAASDDDLTQFAARLSGMWEFVTRTPKAGPMARQLADVALNWARYRIEGAG